MAYLFLERLTEAAIAFTILMLVLFWQVFNSDSWFRKRVMSVIWHEKNWHYERHKKCDGLGVLWWDPVRREWVAIPKNLRTGFPTLGNTRKCTCTMGNVRRLDSNIELTEKDKLS